MRANLEHALDQLARDVGSIVGLMDETAVLQKEKRVRVLEGDVEIVHHCDHGAVLEEASRDVEHVDLVSDVETRRRLIEKQIPAFRLRPGVPDLGEHAGELRLLALTTGEGGIRLVALRGESNDLDGIADNLMIARRRPLGVVWVPAHEHHLPDRERKREVDLLRQHTASARDGVVRQLGQSLIAVENVPLSRRNQPSRDLEKSRLAGAVRTQDDIEAVAVEAGGHAIEDMVTVDDIGDTAGLNHRYRRRQFAAAAAGSREIPALR